MHKLEKNGPEAEFYCTQAENVITYNQYRPCQKTGPVRGSTMDKIITISREYGAGGHSIGQQVAKELGIPFYDRDILKVY